MDVLEYISNLSTNDVQNNLDTLKQIINELDPTIDTEDGPFHDLVLYYSSLFVTANQENINEALIGLDIHALLSDENNIDKDTIDKALANWLIYRKTGKTASGELKVIVSSISPFVVRSGSSFYANGIEFKTTDSYAIRPPGVTKHKTDLILQSEGESRWSFLLPVISKAHGSKGNLIQGTKVQTQYNSIPNLLYIVVPTSFTNGADEESNLQVYNRLHHTLRSGGLNRATIEAELEGENISIIGAGDPEMQRDKINGISSGGCCDIYVKKKDRLVAHLKDKLALTVKDLPLGNIILRAAIPCWINTSIKLKGKIDMLLREQINYIVSTAIDSLPFTETLAISTLMGQLVKLLPASILIDELTIQGEIITADFQMKLTPDAARILVIPSVPEHSISPRTVGFFSSNINILGD